MKRMLSYLGSYKKYFILTPFLIFLEAILDIFLPFLLSKIVDVGIAGGDMNYILRVGGLMMVLSIISLGLSLVAGKMAAKAGMGLARNLRNAIFAKIQDFSFANTNKFNTATLLTRVTNDVTNVQQAAMNTLRGFVRAPVLLIFATAIAFRTNAKLASVFFIAIPILGTFLYLSIQIAHPRFVAMFVWYDKLTKNIQETLRAIREVKAFDRKNYEEEKFLEIATVLRKMSLRAEKFTILDRPLMQTVLYSCIIAILWIGGKFVVAGQMQTGQLFSFIQYLNQSLIALMMISFALVFLVISKASVERITEVLDEEIDIDPNKESKEILSDGGIRFENVDFSYQKEKGELIFNNININIKSGETIGIIGATGTGKTTLVQLIPRLYDVTGGQILVGGKNVKDYSLTTLRNDVAMVLQKNILFSGTILENLKWGDESATQEEIETACKVAQAHEFILAQSKGYETYLDQGGTNLSGGQKQRLCIARALIKKPKIIILDDSTSAVDTDTDARIRHAFKNQLKDTTAIIIAQRISSVSDADRIIVLDGKGIDAIGSHEELMKNNIIYKEIYKLQQREVA